jgi:hypothetical protein
MVELLFGFLQGKRFIGLDEAARHPLLASLEDTERYGETE